MAVNPNNLARTSNYRVFLPALFDEIQYVQGITLPGLSINPVPASNRGLALKLEGDGYIVDPITITLIVDEDFNLAKRIYKTFKQVVHPDDGTYRPDLNFECAIEVTNNSGLPIFAMELHHCALQNITPITLLSNTEDDIITVDLTIEPSYYELIDKLENSELLKKIVNE